MCRRLKALGWRIYYEPAGVVYHGRGASGASARTIEAFHHSAALFARTHIAPRGLALWLVRVLLEVRCRISLVAFARSHRLSGS